MWFLTFEMLWEVVLFTVQGLIIFIMALATIFVPILLIIGIVKWVANKIDKLDEENYKCYEGRYHGD